MTVRFTDAARRVMDLGFAIEEYWEREMRKRHPTYPVIDPAVEEPPPPPEADELRALLRALPPEYVYRLLTLLDLGRQRFRPAAFEAHVPRSRAEYPDIGQAIERVVEWGPLGWEVMDGLGFADQAGVNLDAPVAA